MNAPQPFNRGRPFYYARRRLLALAQRHWFLLLNSWPRAIELFYWVVLNLLVWGFTSTYLSKNTNGHFFTGIFIGAAILWNLTIRNTLGVLLLFMEELYSRNVGHLFVAPYPPLEYAFGLIAISALRTLIAVSVGAAVAYGVFTINIFDLGYSLVLFTLNLVLCGAWIGLLLAALLMRFGQSVEWLGWFGAFLIEPFVGVFYPVSVLPLWAQAIAHILPPTYVFETMRQLFLHQQTEPFNMLIATGLNLIYLSLSCAVFLFAFHKTRVSGGLVHVGE